MKVDKNRVSSIFREMANLLSTCQKGTTEESHERKTQVWFFVREVE